MPEDVRSMEGLGGDTAEVLEVLTGPDALEDEAFAELDAFHFRLAIVDVFHSHRGSRFPKDAIPRFKVHPLELRRDTATSERDGELAEQSRNSVASSRSDAVLELPVRHSALGIGSPCAEKTFTGRQRRVSGKNALAQAARQERSNGQRGADETTVHEFDA